MMIYALCWNIDFVENSFGVKIWTEISIRVKKIDITNVGRHKDGHKDKKTQRQRQKHKQKKTKPQKQTNKQTI